jgi:hypothetical protein
MQKTVVAVLLGTAFAFSALAAEVTGTWTVTGEVVGNAINMKCTFAQDSAKISGKCVGPNGETPTSGTVAGDKLTFTHVVHREQDYELTYSGALDASGNSMKGEIAVMGVTGTFSGTKDAVAPDAAGNWTFTGDVVGNAINMKCAFKRDGTKLSGTCAYLGLGESATTGTVTDKKVVFRNTANNGQEYELTYTGTMDDAGTSMDGDIAVAGVTGGFSGKKDK